MKTIRRWTPALALLLATYGCSAADSPDSSDDPPPFNATIEIGKADVPARYAAALPTTAAGLKRWFEDDESLPPFVHVSDALMKGDVRSFEKLAAAAKAVPAGEAESWARMLDGALQFDVPDEHACALARPVVRAPES